MWIIQVVKYTSYDLYFKMFRNIYAITLKLVSSLIATIEPFYRIKHINEVSGMPRQTQSVIVFL